MTSASFDLSGASVIVTGGTKGIGKIICERFLAAGAHVLTCGRSEPAELPAADGRSADFIPCDVRDIEDLDRLVTRAEDAHGRVDVLVNNAGGSPYAEAADASPKFSESIIKLNLIAPLNLAQRVNATMQRNDGGVIINIGSVSGVRPSPGTAAYGAAKAGMASLTKTLAVEWAPKVRVVGVTCGLIETEQADLHYGNAEGVAAVAATVPLGRMGTPTDVADACLFLSTPSASYITGSDVLLHGGGEWPAFLTAAQAAAQA